MTALNTTGSSLTATTYEGAIEELSTRIASAQASSTTNPQGIIGVSFSSDSRTGQTSYEFALPVTIAVSGSARSITAQNYLTNVSYNSGGALTGGNMLQDLVNLLFDMQNLENTPVSNPTQSNRLSMSIETETPQITASLTLQTDVALVNGKRQYTAVPYLA